MADAIIKILIGYVLWRIVPKWITYGNKKTRERIQLALNIVGVLLVLLGAISIVRYIL